MTWDFKLVLYLMVIYFRFACVRADVLESVMKEWWFNGGHDETDIHMPLITLLVFKTCWIKNRTERQKVEKRRHRLKRKTVDEITHLLLQHLWRPYQGYIITFYDKVNSSLTISKYVNIIVGITLQHAECSGSYMIVLLYNTHIHLRISVCLFLKELNDQLTHFGHSTGEKAKHTNEILSHPFAI